MSIESLILQRDLLLQTAGKTVLNLTFPEDFELYVMALEVLSEQGETLSYFIFPVNPSSFDQTAPEVTNIRKTLGGVTALSHSGFVPVDINISGNFGRRFRILLGEDYKDFLGGFKNVGGGLKSFFSSKIKTGYGTIKVLESVIAEAKKVDNEFGVRTLIFHNLALGNSYVVKTTTTRLTMNQETNMIWNYSLAMKAIAPLSALYTEEELKDIHHRLVITGYLQTQTNRVVNELTNVLSKNLDSVGL